MAYKVAIATAQAAWECRWAREGGRLRPDPPGHPEDVWICIRPTVRGDRRAVTETECSSCPHWRVEDEWPASRR